MVNLPLNGTMQFYLNNTPGTAGGPGGRDRTLAVKSRKTGSIWQIGPGSMWQIGPGSMWHIEPGSIWQIGPGSMWQIKAKDGERKKKKNTPGTAGGPGARDRTLAVKSRNKLGLQCRTRV